jgi:flagellar motor component MotA
MNREEFNEKYYAIAERALGFAAKARREGLLALEDEIDQEKENGRDIFEYGLRFVVDGYDAAIIGEILSNIINQEKDEQLRLLMTIQREAVLSIQTGLNARGMYALLNSHTGLSLLEDKMKEKMEELYA